MRILFFVALLDSAGFGIIIPVFLYYALQLGATPELATLYFSIYPIAIVFSSPLLGLLSDRYGRKPILLVTLLGAFGGYMLLGFAGSLWMLALARFIQGIMAGNMSVVQAYVADTTDHAGRAKGMGTIGAATGLGFVIGPAVGAWLAGDSFDGASLEYAAFASAALSLTAFASVLIFLPESLKAVDRANVEQRKLTLNPFAAVPAALNKPLAKQFFICMLLFNLAGAFGEVILPLWLKDAGVIDGPRDIMWVFLISGLTLSLVQAKGIAPINKLIGEYWMFIAGALLYMVAFLLMPVMGALQTLPGAVAAWSIAGIGMALFFTGMQTTVSKCAEPHERGSVMGAFSAFGLMGRVIGPAIVGTIYASFGSNAHFYMGAALLCVVVLIALSIRGQVSERAALAGDQPVSHGGHGH